MLENKQGNLASDNDFQLVGQRVVSHLTFQMNGNSLREKTKDVGHLLEYLKLFLSNPENQSKYSDLVNWLNYIENNTSYQGKRFCFMNIFSFFLRFQRLTSKEIENIEKLVKQKNEESIPGLRQRIKSLIPEIKAENLT